MVLSAIVAAVGLLALAFPSSASSASSAFSASSAETAKSKIDISAPAPARKSLVVAHNRSDLVDKSRKDPYDSTKNRKVAYSIFMAVWGVTCTVNTDNDYMPYLMAKPSNLQFYGDKNASVFEKLGFKSCSRAKGETPGNHFPLIIFEPAVSTSRLMYNQLARQLSANGAYVVTIDHPYDAPIVESAHSHPIEKKGTI